MVDEDAKWIQLVKNIGSHWPFFTHPDYPDRELTLDGAFRVRWPDGTVTITEVQAKDVNILDKDGKPGVGGTFLYFEREYNGLDLIHELHEVELIEEEVTRCVVDPSQAACAV